MKDQEFQDSLDRYGSDLTRWPAAARDPAHTLLTGSAPARRVHGEVAAIEAILRGTKDELGAPSRLAAHASRHRQRRPAERILTRIGLAASVIAVLAVGIVVGGNLPSRDDNPEPVLRSVFAASEAFDVD